MRVCQGTSLSFVLLWGWLLLSSRVASLWGSWGVLVLGCPRV